MNGSSRRLPALGCVLAGGLSRRMGGGDKALADLAGQPLIAHVVGRLSPQVTATIINANGDPGRFLSLGLPVVADPVAGHPGPLAGLLAAFRYAAESGFDTVLTAAADTPLLPEDLGARLAAVAQPAAKTIALAASNGRDHPVVGLWPVSLADDLAQWLANGGDRSVWAWASRHRVERVDFGGGPQAVDPFFNVNTPDDLATAAGLMTRTDV